MKRSYQKELLDRNDIPFADIKRNMEELDLINRRLGGHKISTQGLAALIRKLPLSEEVRIVEIGCGGGDNLRALKHWAEKNSRRVQLMGIDINAECIVFAQQESKNKDIRFLCSNYKDVVFEEEPHIIFSSLFCHHFTEEELVFQLRWMYRHSLVGFFINDLHRHSLAYYSIKLLTGAFSKSYLVKNDAPLSVQRGFKKKEWNKIFALARIGNFDCRWRWAFRWLIICKCN